MNTKNLTLIVIIAAVLLIGGCGCSSYNGLVQQDETVKNSWNNVQSDYQRRADLIPNLVNTVKGEANFEQTTLTNVIEARAKASSVKIDPSNLTPEKLQEFQQSQGQLSQSLGRLLVVSEQYPNLRANDAFRGLQAQLEGTENRIKVARNDFNNVVANYNVKVRSFPTSIFAGMLGFKSKPGFTADAGSDRVPQVKF
jgi:LemA protein